MQYRTLIPPATILAATGKLAFFAPQSLQDERIERAGLSTDIIIAVDTSADAIPQTSEGDGMYDALVSSLNGVPFNLLLSINSDTKPVLTPSDLTPPGGPPDYSTLGDYIFGAAPLYTLLIVSGAPLNESAAEWLHKKVDECSGRVDVVYFGPSTRRTARGYFASLAATGAGRYVECELPRITRVLSLLVGGLVSSGVP